MARRKRAATQADIIELMVKQATIKAGKDLTALTIAKNMNPETQRILKTRAQGRHDALTDIMKRIGRYLDGDTNALVIS